MKSIQKKKQKKKDKKKKHLDEDSLKEQGNVAYLAKKYDLAIQLFSQAILDDEENHVLFSNRSQVYYTMKKYEEALNDANLAVQYCPDFAKGFYRKAVALYGLKQYKPSLESYHKALTLDPKNTLVQKESDDLEILIKELDISAEEETTAKKFNPEDNKFDIFLEWLDKGKVMYDPLFIKYYDRDYRGVHMRRSVPIDGVILEVPLSHVMTSDVAKASEIGSKIINSDVNLLSTHSYLASYLLQERNKGSHSFWKPYIDTLPTEYANMPVFFQDYEIDWMYGSYSKKKRSDQFEQLKKEYDNLCQAVHEFSKFTLRDFIWARTAVITRIFGMVINDVKTDGLVPMADMLNHKRPRETTWTYDNNKKAFTIVATIALDRGDQVFDSYGRKCNGRFFVNYGFSLENRIGLIPFPNILEGNEDDNEAVITVGITRNDHHAYLKTSLLNSYGYSTIKDFQMPTNYKDKKTRGLFTFLRICHASEKLSAKEAKDNEDIGALSMVNESHVISSIRIAAIKRLEGFDTTLEEDNALLDLKPFPLSSNIRNALIMRQGEKVVLLYYIHLAELCLPLLSMPIKTLKKAHKNKIYLPYEEYINSVIVPLVKCGF